MHPFQKYYMWPNSKAVQVVIYTTLDHSSWKIFYYLKTGQYKADKQLRITVNTREKKFRMSKELQFQGETVAYCRDEQTASEPTGLR